MTVTVGYLPGDCWLVSGDRGLVYLAGEAADAVRWWPAVRAGEAAMGLIGRVRVDGVLGSSTPLAIVCIDDTADTKDDESGDGQPRSTPAVRVVVQGDLPVVVESVDGERTTVNGSGLITWAETLVPAAAVVHLGAAGPLPAGDDLLPMPAGVVRAGPVRWDVAGPRGPVTARHAGQRATPSTGDRTPVADAGEPSADAIGAQPAGDVGAAEPVGPAPDVPGPVGDAGAAEPVGPDPDVPGPVGDDADAAGPAADTPATPSPPAAALAALAATAGQRPTPDVESTRKGDADDAAGAADAADSDAAPVARQDLSRDNPFPSLQLPPFSPPPFVPTSTTLPPVGSPSRPVPRPDDSERSTPRPDPDAVPTGEPPAAPAAGDHDGHTQLAEALPDDYRPPPMPPAPGPGQVYASLCPGGHANAPHSQNCRVCGAPIPGGRPVLTDRPVLAGIRLSSGQLLVLDRRIVIGRAPSANRVPASELPQLVTVASPHQDISRSHVEVRAEDWHVVVADLNSTNGTVVKAPDGPERLLHPGQSVVVDLGWTVDLGDGVTFTVERPG